MATQYPPFTTAGTADAAGNLALTYRTRGNQLTRATQVTAEMAGGSSAVCTLRRNGALISPLVPTGDAATGDPPIYVGPGDELTVEWAGATPGLIGKMVVIYDVLDG